MPEMGVLPTSASDAAHALREHARRVAVNAYAPYSDFRVGAAAQLADGTIVTGCNVENASFGLTICAERAALARVVAKGLDPRTIELIVVHVEGHEGQPCGMCRQFLLELAPHARVAFVSGGELVECDAADLLPAAFIPQALDR